MHVHLCMANHDPMGRQTLMDQLLWVVSGLEENGHSVSVSETAVDADNLNIFWEIFTPELAHYLASSNLKYGIIATEIPDGRGFNDRRDGPWPARWKGFRIAAAHAKFIWPLVETAVDDYRAFAPSAYLGLGYSQRLVPSEPRPKPTYDFSFAGVPHSHRKEIIDRLGASASVHFANELLGYTEQLELLRRGRVGLALKQHPGWKWGSPTRVGRFVHERIPTAHEWVAVDIGVTGLVPKPAEGEDFVNWALARLDSDLEGEADAIFENYRQLPMRECMARAMDLTL